MTDYVNSHHQKGKQKKVQRNMFGDFPLGFQDSGSILLYLWIWRLHNEIRAVALCATKG